MASHLSDQQFDPAIEALASGRILLDSLELRLDSTDLRVRPTGRIGT
jgi:hypothetical protein